MQMQILREQLINPEQKLRLSSQTLSNLSERLKRSYVNHYEEKKVKLNNVAALLDSLSPLKVMDRGYSMALDEKGNIVTSIKKVKLLGGKFSDIIFLPCKPICTN